MYVLDSESIKRAHITLTLAFTNIIFFVVFNLMLPVEFILLLAQDNELIFMNLELWRLFSSMFLHADIIHLFSNMVALIIFGAAVETEYKKYQYLIIYFISGLIGNIFSLFLLSINSISLGASGAIFGLIGAAFILFIREDQSLLILGLMYIGYFLISSIGPGINLWAHLFGLIGGLGFGYLFSRKRDFFSTI